MADDPRNTTSAEVIPDARTPSLWRRRYPRRCRRAGFRGHIHVWRTTVRFPDESERAARCPRQECGREGEGKAGASSRLSLSLSPQNPRRVIKSGAEGSGPTTHPATWERLLRSQCQPGHGDDKAQAASRLAMAGVTSTLSSGLLGGRQRLWCSGTRICRRTTCGRRRSG
jgi:hypothetical protein